MGIFNAVFSNLSSIFCIYFCYSLVRQRLWCPAVYFSPLLICKLFPAGQGGGPNHPFPDCLGILDSMFSGQYCGLQLVTFSWYSYCTPKLSLLTYVHRCSISGYFIRVWVYKRKLESYNGAWNRQHCQPHQKYSASSIFNIYIHLSLYF